MPTTAGFGVHVPLFSSYVHAHVYLRACTCLDFHEMPGVLASARGSPSRSRGAAPRMQILKNRHVNRNIYICT